MTLVSTVRVYIFNQRTINADFSAGDDIQITYYEDLAASYDPEPYWSEIHPHLLSAIQYEQLNPSILKSSTKEDQNILRSLPRNSSGPDGDIPDFLPPLPPSGASGDSIAPWIYAKNPHCREHDTETGDIASFVTEGTDLLHDYENKASNLEVEHDRSGAKTKAALMRKLNPLRRELGKEIFALAREKDVVCGKWMLFPTPDRVDDFWARVAGATVAGELGIEAKVATGNNNDPGKARVLVVYTSDYEDTEDVKRVVKKLRDLGLVKDGLKPIYYKAEAYSLLGIGSDNPYGLKASLYSSKDVLAGKV